MMIKVAKIFILFIVLNFQPKFGDTLQLSQQDLSNCGVSKGCAFFPPKCEDTVSTATRDSNCTGAFLFQTFPAGISFTLLGVTHDLSGAGFIPMYVAVGFSLDEHMVRFLGVFEANQF